jgi:beta-glucosidase
MKIKTMKRTLVALSLLLTLSANAQQTSIDSRVEALLSQMTLEEKLGQLTQFVPDQPAFRPALAKGLVGSVLNSGTAAQTNEIQRAAVAGSRLKIPLIIGHDVIHGYRTIFPIPLAIASSWDPEMARLAARIGATEARTTGIRWTFAPMVDIARDPRWGRIAEGAGEDPFLGSAMAAAYVRGFQGANPAAPDALLACAKHFAAYGAAEGGRDYATTDMSEATLREVYLPPFKAAVDAGVGSLMSAFNAVNGVPATSNAFLLDTVLRGEWKFNGFVVSDWSAVTEVINHGAASDPSDAALKALTAGVDLDMWANSYITLADAVRSGRLPVAVVDRAVRRILRAKFLVGLFDDPYTDEKRAASIILAPAHRQAARQVAQRSIVLLKNEGSLLPLPKPGRTIAIVGPLAESKTDMLGPWAAEGKPEETVSVMEGLRAKLGTTAFMHASGGAVSKASDEELATAVTAANRADVIVAVLGEDRDMSGEAASRSSLDLPGRQQELLQRLVATGKPVVLVVMSGRPLSISWAAEHVPAIVQGWFLGTEGGHAIADVLFGDVNPSGRLPVTMPRTVGQVPIYHAMLPSGRPADPANKFTSKYIDLPLGPLYPFGHGLTYTKFAYSNLQVTSCGEACFRVSADIANTGSRAGTETAQLYINDPVASVSRPVRQLKGYQRVSLGPGESKRVEFTVDRSALQFWYEGQWRTEPGKFNVWIAPDAASGLQGSFELK